VERRRGHQRSDEDLAQFDRPLSRHACDRSGSVRVTHATALNGGTTIRRRPSHLDGCAGLYSGHSIRSRQCRRPARSGRRLMRWHLPNGGHRASGDGCTSAQLRRSTRSLKMGSKWGLGRGSAAQAIREAAPAAAAVRAKSGTRGSFRLHLAAATSGSCLANWRKEQVLIG
jgi:hypothetical protein